jgi:hypothetical protein
MMVYNFSFVGTIIDIEGTILLKHCGVAVKQDLHFCIRGFHDYDTVLFALLRLRNCTFKVNEGKLVQGRAHNYVFRGLSLFSAKFNTAAVLVESNGG